MNLKKNDKIILIVGVVILVVAGIGIVFYTSPVNEKPVGEANTDNNIYTYTWTQNTGEKIIGDALTAGKGAPYEEPIFIQGQSGTVITSVEFQLDWEDDVTYGILRKKGLDTLAADISYKTDTKTETSSGNGNHTFVFTINERPKDGTIEAKSREDALDHLQNNISGKNSASFDITVSVETGESFIRLLKFLKDKGNDFSLTATYTYYTMSLQESEPSNDDTDDDTKKTGDDGFNHNVGEFYVKLGYGRGMI